MVEQGIDTASSVITLITGIGSAIGFAIDKYNNGKQKCYTEKYMLETVIPDMEKEIEKDMALATKLCSYLDNIFSSTINLVAIIGEKNLVTLAKETIELKKGVTIALKDLFHQKADTCAYLERRKKNGFPWTCWERKKKETEDSFDYFLKSFKKFYNCTDQAFIFANKILELSKKCEKIKFDDY